MGTLVKFKAGYEPFKPYMFNDTIVQTVTPACWWRSLDAIVGKEITTIAKKLLTSVASNAGVERIFSTFGYIQT